MTTATSPHVAVMAAAEDRAGRRMIAGRLIAPSDLPAATLRYMMPQNGVADPQVVVLIDTAMTAPINLEDEGEVCMATVQTFSQVVLCVEEKFLRPANDIEMIGFLDEFGAWYDVKRLEAIERAHLDEVNQDLGGGALVELVNAEQTRNYEEILYEWANHEDPPSKGQLRIMRSPYLRRKFLWRGGTATVVHPPKEVGGPFMIRRAPGECLLRYRWHDLRPANDL